MMLSLDEQLKLIQEAEEIKCPKCGYVFTPEETQDYATFWGEDGPQDAECLSCETKLVIDEMVSRTFDVTVYVGVENSQTRRKGGE